MNYNNYNNYKYHKENKFKISEGCDKVFHWILEKETDLGFVTIGLYKSEQDALRSKWEHS